MHEEADAVICLEEQDDFGALGFHYANFRQIADEEVVDLLARFSEHVPAG
jgi:predicted phosphoribosyltransferase